LYIEGIMKTIYLVRHGMTQANADGRFQGWEDHPLNETGRSQAESLAERAKGLKLTKLYASDLIRTHETLAPLAKIKEMPITTKKGLREISFGDWEGEKITDIQRTQGKLLDTLWRHAADAHIPGGEDLFKAQERGWDAFDAIRQEMAENTKVMVASHGGMIRLLLCKILDANLNQIWHFCIDNTSVCRIEYDRRIGYRIRYVNYLGTLE
jgi:broad specificity phosphatase PhoE